MENAAVHKSASFKKEERYFPNPADESADEKDNNIVTDCVFGGIFVGSRFAISFARHVIYCINIAYDYNKIYQNRNCGRGHAIMELRIGSILRIGGDCGC